MQKGEKWVEQQHCPNISEFGRSVANLLDDLFFGIYHISNEVRHKRVDWTSDRWIEIVIYGCLVSYDRSDLTKLVLLAHEMCIRVEVSAVSNGYLKLSFSPRHRKGNIWERHPTIEEAVGLFRESRSPAS